MNSLDDERICLEYHDIVQIVNIHNDEPDCFAVNIISLTLFDSAGQKLCLLYESQLFLS